VRADWRELIAGLRRHAAEFNGDAAGGVSGEQDGARLARGRGSWLLGLFGAGRRANLDLAAPGAHPDRQSSGAHPDFALGGRQPWYVLSHVSSTSRVLDRFFLCCYAWEMLVQPLMLAFWDHTVRMVWLIDVFYVLDAVYVLRIVIRMHTSFVNAKSVIIYGPAEIRRHYVTTECTYDVFMSWPHNLFALALSAPSAVVVSLRLLRLGLCRYLWCAYVAWEKRQADNDLLSGLVRFLGVTLLFSHMFACAWNALGFQVEIGGGAGGLQGATLGSRWPAKYNELQHNAGATHESDLLHDEASVVATLAKRYTVSLYFALSMLSALGLNQLPTNYMEIGFYLGGLVANMTVFSWTGEAARSSL
jgi:hypothetical protein